MKKAEMEKLAAFLEERLGVRSLHTQQHRATSAIVKLTRQLEARGLASVVRTFMNPGSDPFLKQRAARAMSSMSGKKNSSRQPSSR